MSGEPDDEEFDDDDLPPPEDEDDFEEDDAPEDDFDDNDEPLDDGDFDEEFDEDEPQPPEDDEDFENEEGDFDEDEPEDEPEDDEPEDDEGDFEDDEPEDDDEDFDDTPPPPPGPPKSSDSKLKVPVNIPKSGGQSKAGNALGPGSAIPNVNLDILSSGLTIKEPPQLLQRKSVAPPPPPSGTKRVSMGPVTSMGPQGDQQQQQSEVSRQQQIDTIRKSIAVANSRASMSVGPPPPPPDENDSSVKTDALAKGFIEAQGKFEGDPFEHMFIKVNQTSAAEGSGSENVGGGRLQIILATGEEVDFDLSAHSFVFEDSTDPTSFILDHKKLIVVFKVDSVDTFNIVMKQMPPAVFMVAELSEAEQKLLKEKEARKAKTVVPPKYRAKSTTVNRVKGTSVEDILEQDFEGQTYNQQAPTDFTLSNQHTSAGSISMASVTHFELTPQRRKELVETHILKPKYSVRRVTLLCEWVNALHIWPNPLQIGSIHKEMCNGMLLAKIVKSLNPAVQYVNLNERALAKKPALQNLEQALGHIWRAKTLNSSRVPSAMVIYSGNTSKIAILLNELFTVYVQRPLYKNAVRILKWYHWMLKQYLRPLPNAIFEEGDLSGVWPHFQSGAAIFCVIYHLFGPIVIGEGDKEIRIDPLRVAGSPASICDFRDNLSYVFQLLRALDIDVLWTPEDWITHPDTEFVMLQLSFVYEALKNKQCSLPPAQGGSAGLTSGPNGEPIVAGLIFSDTRPPNSRLLLQTKKAVLLGHDKDSMALLPVDRGNKTGRFVQSGSCPLGMVSNHAKVQQISIAIKESKVHSERGGWNASASTLTEKERFVGSHIVNLLREHNKRTEHDANFMTVASTLKSQPNSPGKTARAAANTTKPVGSSAAAQESRTKQIEAAVKNLEHEMTVSQTQLTALEDALANRYMELEGSAESIDLGEYEAALDSLEVERRELEEEKLRLQDHFARKLESIKEIYKDVESSRGSGAALEAQDLDTSHLSAASSNAKRSPHGATGHNASFSSTNNNSNNKASKTAAVNLSQAEKGWIKGSKMSTHNFHLKNLQNASSSALKSAWTPKSLREKEKAREVEEKKAQLLQQQQTKQLLRNKSSSSILLQHSDHSHQQQSPNHLQDLAEHLYPADLEVPPPPPGHPGFSQEEQIERSFKKFQYRLHIASLRFQQSKQQSGRAKLQDYLRTSVRTSTVEPISLPDKSFVSSQHRFEEQEELQERSYEMAALSAAIREDELHRMTYEDERRRLLLSEQALQHSYHLSQKLFSAPASSPSRSNRGASSNNSYQSQQSSVNSGSSPPQHTRLHNLDVSMDMLLDGDALRRPSDSEVGVALKWLGVHRKLVIADRVPKEFVFTTCESASGGFVLEWHEIISAQGGAPQLYLVGCVAVEDIREISESKQDATQFTVHINGNNTRALKNSKGRTSLAIQCNSSGECGKYMASLICLKKSLL